MVATTMRVGFFFCTVKKVESWKLKVENLVISCQ